MRELIEAHARIAKMLQEIIAMLEDHAERIKRLEDAYASTKERD
jgi:hypothetical protein